MADPLPSAPPDGVGYSINTYSSDGRGASEVIGAGVFGAEDDGSAGNGLPIMWDGGWCGDDQVMLVGWCCPSMVVRHHN